MKNQEVSGCRKVADYRASITENSGYRANPFAGMCFTFGNTMQSCSSEAVKEVLQLVEKQKAKEITPPPFSTPAIKK